MYVYIAIATVYHCSMFSYQCKRQSAGLGYSSHMLKLFPCFDWNI